MSVKKTDGKSRVVIVGSIVSGRSGSGWYGRYTGTETVIKAIGSSGPVDVYINSPGGSVFAGFEILNALNAAVSAGREVTMYVSALAASMASYISSGVVGAKVYMADNAKLMFHAPWTYAEGSKDQLRDTADLLGKMEEDIVRAIESRGAKAEQKWFAAGRAKWFAAKEAVQAKLADGIKNPPAELIEAAATETGSSVRDSGWGKTKGERGADKITMRDAFAASSSFEGYLRMMAEEKYGEDIDVAVNADGTFRVTKGDGAFALLNYRPDSLNIVSVDWESADFKAQQESEMSKPNEKPSEPAAPAASAKPEAPVAPAVPVAETPVVAPEKPSEPAAPAASAKPEAPVAPAVPVAETPKPTLPAGLTEDMVAFALASYKPARDEHLATIKASKTCAFTDAELDKFDFETLAKMAKLAAKPAEQGAALKTDNSLIAPAPAAKGTGGTLPPPEN